MDLGERLLAIGNGERAASFEIFSESLDSQWIAQALAATGMASIRRRKLPAEYVVWIVIGMALLRDRSIVEVVRHLDLVVPTPKGERREVTGGAIAQARDRLGPDPLAWLFRRTAEAWADPSAGENRWRELAVFGVDGTTLRVPDSTENDAHFGRPGTSRGEAGYPQARVVALMALRSHLLVDLAVGPYAESEMTLAKALWPRLPARSLVVVDRGFASYALFHQLADPGHERHWLTRAKRGKTALKWKVLAALGTDDALIELRPSRMIRRLHPELPEQMRVRAIRYKRRGFRTQTLLTSLLDPKAYPAEEIVGLYHERWELELGFDEMKTHTLEREEASLRSKAPARISQELWGLAIGYNLVRLAMARVAAQAGVPPARISYRHALNFIRVFWLTAWMSSPGVLPRRLDALHEELRLLILPERRVRRCPRAVKIKMSNYPRKCPRRRSRRLN